MRSEIWRGVEAQPRDDGVSVAVTRVNCDPFATAALAVVAKLSGADRRFQQAGGAECVGNRSRTVIAAVDERFVAAAKNVRLSEKLVGRPDRAFYSEWRRFRSGRFA